MRKGSERRTRGVQFAHVCSEPFGGTELNGDALRNDSDGGSALAVRRYFETDQNKNGKDMNGLELRRLDSLLMSN